MLTQHVAARAIRVALVAVVGIVTPAMAVEPKTAYGAQTPALVGFGAASEAGVCADGLSSMTLPASARFGFPSDVLSAAGKPDWIFGQWVGGRRPVRPLALHWVRGTWRDLPLPWSNVNSGLLGGDASGPSRAWAVGFERPDGRESLRPIVARWDGRAWTNVPVPDLNGRATLVDAAMLPTGGLLAVGTRLSRGRTHALALLRKGGDWVRADPPVVSSESGLVGVARDPSGAAWAVGWQMDGGAPRPLMVKRSLNRWTVEPSASLPAGTSVLTDIAFRSATEGWAVGYLAPAHDVRTVPILEHWDGDRWIRAGLPWARSISATLRSVSVGADGSLAVTGTILPTDSERSTGFAATRVNGTWRVMRLRSSSTDWSELVGTAAVRGGAIVVGTGAQHSLVYETCTASNSGSASAPASEPVVPARTADEGGTSSVSWAGQGAPTSIASKGFFLRDVAGASGLAELTKTYGAIATDFDGDGWVDVFYSRHKAVPRLALGGPHGFRDRATPIPSFDRHGCAAADVDGDGSTDLFCAMGANRGTMTKGNELWLDLATRSVRSAPATYGVLDPFGRGRHATFLNLDGDRYPNLFVTTEAERVDGLPSTNGLYRNVAGTRFEYVPNAELDQSVGGSCASGADLNGDGLDDLLVCTVEASGRIRAGLHVFINHDSVLRDQTSALGLEPIGDRDALAADFNGDGHPDLAQVGDEKLRVSLGDGKRFSKAWEIPLTDGVALAAGDVNGDHRPDLYVVRSSMAGNDRDLLLVNTARGRSFTSVSIPQVSTGRGDDVVSLDFDHNGLADFVVLNGLETRGPVQLLASYLSH
jgi:hypothetical protein